MRKKTIEDYVELIYKLQTNNTPVHTTAIASSFGINPASVTEAFQKLHDEGYVYYEKYAGVTLTKKGKKIAIQTQHKHETLKQFLILLGIDEQIANDDACKIEHIVNPATMKRLRKFVEYASKFHENPRWLDHFDHYYKTGEFIGCTRKTVEKCPIDTKGRQ